jgi:hypothetical protein
MPDAVTFEAPVEQVERFSSPPKEGEEILSMMTTGFASKLHRKVALENLTLVLMQPRRRELGWF